MLCWLVIHLVGWTLVPLLSNTSLHLDTAEALYWGHEWQWGYDKHPPLSAWAAEIFGRLFGDWGLYLLSQVCIVAAAGGLWLLGGELRLSCTQRVLGVLLLDCVFYYTYATPEFNVNVLQLPFWTFGWWAGLAAVRSGAWRHWIVLGVCVGLGALVKYFAVFLLVPLFCAWWQRGELKRAMRSAGLYVAGAVSMLVFLPHLLWMRANDWMTFTYGLRRAGETDAGFLSAHVLLPLEFLAGQLAFLIPVLGISLWAGKGRPQKVSARNGLSGLVWGGFAGLFVLSVVAGWDPVTMWAMPMPLAIGLWCVANLRSNFDPARVVKGALVFSALSLTAYAVVNAGGPLMRNKPHRTNYDGQALANAVEQLYFDEVGQPLEYVLGERFPSALTAWYGEQRATVVVLGDEKLTPGVTNDDIREAGGMVLWRKSYDAQKEKIREIERILPVVLENFPEAEFLDDLIIPWPRRNDGKAGRFGVAIIRPQ